MEEPPGIAALQSDPAAVRGLGPTTGPTGAAHLHEMGSEAYIQMEASTLLTKPVAGLAPQQMSVAHSRTPECQDYIEFPKFWHMGAFQPSGEECPCFRPV